jgi:hypothetical protein
LGLLQPLMTLAGREPKTSQRRSMTTGTLLQRYQAGERDAVWTELRELGPLVREASYAEDALAVARETMRRAKANVETIIERLDRLGYRFWDGVQGPRRGPPRKLAFGQSQLEAPSAELLLAAMFEEARKLPAGLLTAVMVEQLHNIYRMAVWPWQDTSQLARGQRHSADAEATARFEQAKKTAPAEVASGWLPELERLSATAIDQLRSAARERESGRNQAAAAMDHRKDKRVLQPPQKKEAGLIKRLEKRGFFLPLALRAWVEEVGAVNLAGSHPLLCFWEDASFPGIYADPLMIAVDLAEIEAWVDEPEGDGLKSVVGWNARAKAQLTTVDAQLDDGYSISLPAKIADPPLAGGAAQSTFVDYLRLAFRWGGFPGWERQKHQPENELQFLAENLLPL